MAEPVVRAFAPDDIDACYEVCLRTGDSGRDASALYADPRLLGELYLGPYLARWPEHAFVVADEISVGGYIVGAADTVEHERWMEREWLPPLREKYPIDAFASGSADAAIVRSFHHPDRSPQEISADWPAHLHIDLLPRFQGRGYGRALMEVFLESLQTAGVPAVHLGVSTDNLKAVGFYERMGFADLGGRTLWGRSTLLTR